MIRKLVALLAIALLLLVLPAATMAAQEGSHTDLGKKKSADHSAASLAGEWKGLLRIPTGGELRLVLKVEATKEGTKATLVSVDQGGQAIPVDTIALDTDKVSFEIKNILGSFVGKLNTEKSVMEGEWSQGGMSIPLSLARAVNP